MRLDYLLFDFSDEDSGRGSFDAMASVEAARLPALWAEVNAVLRWAHAAFGAPDAPGDEGEWAYDLQALHEPDAPLAIQAGDAGAVALRHPPAAGRLTLTFTLGGSPAFCAALREAFELED